MFPLFLVIVLGLLILAIGGMIAVYNFGRGIDSDPLHYAEGKRARFLKKAEKVSQAEKEKLIMQKWGSILSLDRAALGRDNLKAALCEMFKALQDAGLDFRNVADFLVVNRPANSSFIKVKLPNGELVAFKYDVVTHRLIGMGVERAYGPLREELANSLRRIMEVKGLRSTVATQSC